MESKGDISLNGTKGAEFMMAKVIREEKQTFPQESSH
jgi:hypothetical protein